MLTSTLLATIVGVATVNAAHGQGSFRVPDLITKDWILNQARNSSLFTRWRPRSHFIAPAGWMNDPCGAVYDPTTDLYHLQYQFHPNHAFWGNVSWGHAVSKDLFHWSDIRGWQDDLSVSLAPGRFEGGPISFFSGSTQPVNLNGKQDGTLLSFVTSVYDLPTNWLKPYRKGMEVQSIFSSTDHGETWKDLGHIIEGPPQGWSVTGFRDPYVFPSPELDAIRGVGPHYYLTLGSGLKGQTRATSPNNKRPGFLGARMPLYAAPASDLKRWSFIGPVWESAPNASLGHPDVTGSYGYNFETSGIFTLPINRNGGSSRANSAWFALMGTEGGNTALHQHEHWAVWSRGTMSATGGRGGGAKFTPTSSGAADWGISYAHTSFVDGRRGNGNRRVMWGWANEDIDDRKNHPIGSWQYHVLKAFGYGGCMNLPLELFVKSTPGLRRSSTYSDGNEWIPDSKSAYTAQTMGIRPLPDVMRLLTNGAIQKTFNVGVLQAYSAPIKVIQNAGDSWVMKVTLKPIQGTAGIIIAQSPDNAEYTRIIYDAHAKQIVVQREHSTLLKGVFNTHTLTGHFEPYTSATGVTEDINFTIVFDKSLVEIFVNDRFALTTRVYTVRPDSTGISFFAGRANPATWTQATIWKGLNKAWPKRPEDSSSRLVWDSPKVTNGYTYWEGW